ncbi:hypothetical protein ALC60_13771, partial [Trachymyrmex zeteki]
THSNELPKRHTADKLLAEEARKRIVARDSTLGDRTAATAVWVAMKAKTKLGMGLKTRKRKSKRILPIAKRDGVLPILPLLGVLGSLVGGAAGVAKVVNDSKAAQHQLQELQRHNRVMEGHGVCLAPYKRGRGIARKKKNVDETLKLPKGVTTNVQLQQLANRMCIPYFRVSAIFDRRRNLNDIWFSFPHSNAEAERIFSIVTDVKNKKRNRLSNETISAICIVRSSFQAENINCINFEVDSPHLELHNAQNLYEKKCNQSDGF